MSEKKPDKKEPAAQSNKVQPIANNNAIDDNTATDINVTKLNQSSIAVMVDKDQVSPERKRTEY